MQVEDWRVYRRWEDAGTEEVEFGIRDAVSENQQQVQTFGTFNYTVVLGSLGLQ